MYIDEFWMNCDFIVISCLRKLKITVILLHRDIEFYVLEIFTFFLLIKPKVYNCYCVFNFFTLFIFAICLHKYVKTNSYSYIKIIDLPVRLFSCTMKKKSTKYRITAHYMYMVDCSTTS